MFHHCQTPSQNYFLPDHVEMFPSHHQLKKNIFEKWKITKLIILRFLSTRQSFNFSVIYTKIQMSHLSFFCVSLNYCHCFKFLPFIVIMDFILILFSQLFREMKTFGSSRVSLKLIKNENKCTACDDSAVAERFLNITDFFFMCAQTFFTSFFYSHF